jgi:two-component system CheB/CheR fusion protein
VADRTNRPDVVIADYSLPGDWNGVQLVARLREVLGYNIPTVILTGDISIETLLEISKGRLIQRSKPVPADDLRDLVQSLLGRQVTARLHSSR